MKPIKFILSGIANVASWSMKTALRPNPKFDLKYYHKDWDNAGTKLYTGWTDLGSSLGVRDPELPPVLIYPHDTVEVPEPQQPALHEKAADALEAVSEAAKDHAKTIAGAGLKSAVVMTDLAKTAGVQVGSSVVSVAKTGWKSILGLKDKLIKKAEELKENKQTEEEVKQPPEEEPNKQEEPTEEEQ